MWKQSIKTIDVFQVKFTKKNNIQVLMILKMTVIKRRITSNSEIKEEVYEEDDRIEGDLSNRIENQIDFEKNDNQEQDIQINCVENVENDQEHELVYQDIQRLKDATSRPKSNVNVQFMLKNGEKVQAKVLSKQPKHTGASQNRLNFEIAGKEETSSVNWDEVLWWRKIKSEQILMLPATKENSQEVLHAKERELNSLKENMTLTGLKIMVKIVFHARRSSQKNKRRMEVRCWKLN